MKKLNLLDANGNSYVVEIPDDFYPETMVVGEPEPVDETQEKDFEKVSVLSNSGFVGDDEVREMTIEMYDYLAKLSREEERNLTGTCIYKYRTSKRYERLSVKAWNKLMEVKAYCIENGLVGADEDDLSNILFEYACNYAFEGDLSHLDSVEEIYNDKKHALASNDFQTVISKLCKLLRMCFYSNSLTFHDRLEVELAVDGFGDWVRPEVVKEYSELCW